MKLVKQNMATRSSSRTPSRLISPAKSQMINSHDKVMGQRLAMANGGRLGSFTSPASPGSSRRPSMREGGETAKRSAEAVERIEVRLMRLEELFVKDIERRSTLPAALHPHPVAAAERK